MKTKLTLGKDKEKFGICIRHTLDQRGLITEAEFTLKTGRQSIPLHQVSFTVVQTG